MEKDILCSKFNESFLSLLLFLNLYTSLLDVTLASGAKINWFKFLVSFLILVVENTIGL